MTDKNLLLIIGSGIGLMWLASNNKSAIGKLNDTYNVKRGGRVDKHWGLPDIDPQYLGRVAKSERGQKQYNIPEKAIEHFNLHAIEFGNWMNQEDRANFMFASLVSLSDMAKVMNVPQFKMGLEHKISLSLGARGTGGYAAAFYQRNPIAVINLTKTSGKNFLAHEIGHALDEHLNIKLNNRNGYISGGRSTRHRTDLERFDRNSTEYQFEKVFDSILWKENGEPTKYKKWLKKMNSNYLNRRTELWARIFEGYIAMKFRERGIKNNWAVSLNGRIDVPSDDLLKKAAPHIQRIIRAAFD